MFTSGLYENIYYLFKQLPHAKRRFDTLPLDPLRLDKTAKQQLARFTSVTVKVVDVTVQWTEINLLRTS